MTDKHETTAVLDPRSTLDKAIEKGLDPVTIGKLMDLQERWEAGKARKAYVEAMAGFKRDCPSVIGKDKKADFGTGKAKYSYASTGAIVTAITPALSKYGLSLSWESQQRERLVSVTCHVTHSEGHRESASLTGPHDESGGKNPIQTLGSTVHYLQRYTMVSVLGLATADMDDPDTRPPIKPTTTKTENPPPPAAPQETGIEGVLSVTGTLDIVEVRNGTNKKTNKPWTKYGIVMGENVYGTFDSALGEAAQNLQGETVTVDWTDDGKYKTAVAVRPATAKTEDNGELPL